MTDQVHKLGEVLRAAREAKGLDLPRVERETKIRERYLSALERGEYRELPGAVYTKGFLRNYAAYLGLDPEYLIDLYRLETAGAERAPTSLRPRPLAARRSRAFVVTPNAIAAAILTFMVGAFLAYLGYGLVNFARTPELRITDPPTDVSGHGELTITLRGVTAPNATVRVSNLPENPSVEADANGNFEVSVELLPGSNVVQLVAHDPVTDRDSEMEERTIIVAVEPAPSASPPKAVALEVSEPAADASVSGAVPVTGTAAASTTVTISATLTAPPALDFAVTDAAGQPVPLTPAAPTPPEPTTLNADSAGAFAGSVNLPRGTWELTIETERTEPVVRAVTVQAPEGLRAIIAVEGGDSYLELEQDGTAADGSGEIARAGARIDLSASESLRIRAGNADAVQVTVNGIGLGKMGGVGAVVEWRIEREG